METATRVPATIRDMNENRFGNRIPDGILFSRITVTITEPERKSMLQFARASPASRASFCYPAIRPVVELGSSDSAMLDLAFGIIRCFKQSSRIPIKVPNTPPVTAAVKSSAKLPFTRNANSIGASQNPITSIGAVQPIRGIKATSEMPNVAVMKFISGSPVNGR